MWLPPPRGRPVESGIDEWFDYEPTDNLFYLARLFPGRLSGLCVGPMEVPRILPGLIPTDCEVAIARMGPGAAGE